MADTFYDDVMLMLPGNTRNLVDRAMTYCLGHNWQIADEFIRNDVLSRAHIRWNATANFYMGWALTGGIVEELELPLLNSFLRKLVSNHQGLVVADFKVILGKATAYLDYAIYQRPRYASSWHQTDWLSSFQEAIKKIEDLERKKIGENNILFQNKPMQNSFNQDLQALNIAAFDYLNNLQRWLAWRMYGYGYQPDDSQMKERIQELERIEGKPYVTYKEIYNDLTKLRMEIIIFLKDVIDEQNIVGGLENIWQRLSLAGKLFKLWKKADQNFKFADLKQEVDITFLERWCIDVYAEIATLTVRMLAEGRAYETARELANRANRRLKDWIEKRWVKYYASKTKSYSFLGKECNDFKFSPFVLRYQRATLCAWQAYTTLYQWENLASKARLKAQGGQIIDDLNRYLDETQNWVTEALILQPQHPLAVFVQARIFQKRDLYERAIEELLHLLRIVAPFDPKSHTANWETGHRARAKKADPDEKTTDKSLNPRLRLYYMERVSGQREFEDILDRSHIHLALAELFVKVKNLELSIYHFQQAIAWSPYYDRDVNSFFELVTQLSQTDKFTEALDAIQEIRARLPKISQFSLSPVQDLEVIVLECTAHTRLGNYHRSLQIVADELDPNFKDNELDLSFEKVDTVILSRQNYQINDNQFKIIFEKVMDKISEFIQEDNDDIWRNFEEENFNDQEGDIENDLQKRVSTFLEKTPNLLRLARCNLNEDYIVKWLRKNNPYPLNGVDKFDPKWVIQSQIFSFISGDSLRLLIQKCELANNIAFNLAELDNDLKKAQSFGEAAIDLITILQTLPQDNSEFRQQYESYIAQYCDTLGWVKYRQSWRTSNNLEDVIELLRRALRYNPSLAIVHYHLAHVLIRQIEQNWQKLPFEKKKDVPEPVSIMITRNLHDAQHHWNIAKKLDKSNRLELKLLRLFKRISTYKDHWERIQILPLDRKNVE